VGCLLTYSLGETKNNRNFDELKKKLVEVWIDQEQNIIDTAINEWTKHLRACVRVMG